MRNVVLEGENDQLKRTGSKPTLAEEAAQAAKAAAVAAADLAKASQELLTSKIEGGWIKLQFNTCKIYINVLILLIFVDIFCYLLLHMVLHFAEKRYFVQVVSLLDRQVEEMKLMINAVKRLEGIPMLWIFAKGGFCLGYDKGNCIFVQKALDCLFYHFAVALFVY